MNINLSALELPQALVRFDTINPPGNERLCAEHLGSILDDAGFAVSYHEFAETRTSLVARIGGNADAKPLCFTGHIDTVPLGAAPWSVDPFAADIADGKLYGRGTSDMKSGVAAFVVAAIRLARELETGPGMVLIITAGEETGCEGAYHLAGLGNVLGDAGAIVVAEPSSNLPFIGHKGALWLKAVANGLTAHGSMPELGVNAIYKAARTISQLEDFDFNVARHPVLGKPTLNVGTVHGGININSVPDRAEVGIDIRTLPDQDHGDLCAHLSSYLGDDIAVEPIVDVGSVWTDPAEDWMLDVFDVMAEILGKMPEVCTATYFTDAAALTPAYGGPPTVILGPGEADMAHQTDEYCVVDRIDQAVDGYVEIAKRWNAQ